MGRKRKWNVARQADGRVKAEKPRPHLQRVADFARMMRDPTLGTPLGTLYAQNKISQELYEAGCAYREAKAEWVAAMRLPSPHARAQDISRVHGLAIEPDPELEARRRVRAQKRLESYDMAIGSHSLELSCVQATCVDDLVPVGHPQLLALVCGLTRLAAWRKGGRS
jgi:hypothetical protein